MIYGQVAYWKMNCVPFCFRLKAFLWIWLLSNHTLGDIVASAFGMTWALRRDWSKCSGRRRWAIFFNAHSEMIAITDCVTTANANSVPSQFVIDRSQQFLGALSTSSLPCWKHLWNHDNNEEERHWCLFDWLLQNQPVFLFAVSMAPPFAVHRTEKAIKVH